MYVCIYVCACVCVRVGDRVAVVNDGEQCVSVQQKVKGPKDVAASSMHAPESLLLFNHKSVNAVNPAMDSGIVPV